MGDRPRTLRQKHFKGGIGAIILVVVVDGFPPPFFEFFLFSFHVLNLELPILPHLVQG